MNPFVSVIVPNYNHELFLETRINSIINQTYQNFELIILDDCSIDNSAEIIERFRNHAKVNTIVYNKKNSGSPFKQWKKGIQMAKGEWIWIAESDDYCLPELLETLVDSTKSCRNTALSYCQSFEADEKGNVERDLSWHVEDLDPKRWKKDFCNEGLDEIKNFLVYRNTIPNASAVLFRKSAYQKAEKNFEKMKMCGDWLLWVQLLQQGSIAFKAQPLNFFRQHSVTTRVLDTKEKIIKRLGEEYYVLENIKRCIEPGKRKIVLNRIDSILFQYDSLFTNRDIVKYLVRPFSYNEHVPFLSLLSRYCKNRLRSVLQR
jgi:glycosyltransferase involved in cell wall biosynthesis